LHAGSQHHPKHDEDWEGPRLLSRRSFLNSALGAGFASTTSDQAAAQTPAVQPAHKRLIVDAQVHVWQAESADWPWIPGLKPQMPEPFTIEKLVPLMDEAGVDRAVIVPPDWPGYRNDYGLEAAKRYPNRFAVMGRIPLKNPRSAALLPTWKKQPGMLGVRVEGWPTDGTADWFWPAAEKAGLPIMFLINGRSAQVVRIAERHPQLTLIVDHMGVTADIVKAGKLADAIDQTLLLAKYSNISVKLSAAPNYSTESYPFRDFLPHIRRLFDAYGPQRCYWGTDITNGFDRATYRQRITHFTEELPFLSEEDKDWIMGRAIVARLDWLPA
jgi:predicted TIM-barrel fold metal-dependent hydrolase